MLRITKIFPEIPGQMSVGSCIILAMFKSFWYVCTNCDASIEVVSKGIHFQDPTCNCNNSAVVWCQTGVVESDTKKRKENMETIPDTYNPNALVTVKKIVDGQATYETFKVVDLEGALYVNPTMDVLEHMPNGEIIMHTMQRTDVSELFRKRQFDINKINTLQSQVNKIIDNLTADYWYNPNTDKETILYDICEILGHEPKQEVTITATVQVEVKYDCPLEEIEDFDARDFLQDVLTIDAYHGDVIVDSFDVDHADWATS